MKNLIAVGILAVLGAVAFFMFREKPNPEKKQVEAAVKPVDVEKLDEIRIKRHEGLGDKKEPESYTLKKADGTWAMAEPVKYPVVQNSVETMTRALGELRVIDVISEKASAHGKFEVDDASGIDVTVLGGGSELLHVIVGASSNGVTFIRYPDKNEVYRMKGSFKYNFDRSIKSLREKTIIKADVENVKTATFGSGDEALVLEKTGTGKDLSVKPLGRDIPNFDAPKATGVLRTLVNLNAVGFVDEPVTEEVSGLGPDAFTVTLEAIEEDKPYKAVLTLGNKVEDKAQTYAKTSASDQIFLISEYTAKRLYAKLEDLTKKEEKKDK